ncbi:DUF3566 domain-containing protein [Actinotalea sp. JY-7885]|uniref:DUF3566 domain-containing protein n=1 Tax=Actinotalea sp. JY-7885 TaxID=2758576 RepID=UPI001CB6BD9C|nr:DUF3566 domain-containing protein [Actinotalea sp. JY-7885]
MSTDGTQPPSIAPQRPAAKPGSTGAGTAVRPGAAPATGTPSTPAREPDESGASGRSFTERMKQSAQGAVETARTALPTKDATEPAKPARTSTKPAAAASTSSISGSGPRRVRLSVARIDPWSVMKLSFLLSVAVGIMIVVAAAVVWYTLDGLHVFASVNDIAATLSGSETFFRVEDYLGFERIISLATMVGVIDIVLLTALSTIGAFLYNIVAALVGGVHLTLTDD